MSLDIIPGVLQIHKFELFANISSFCSLTHHPKVFSLQLPPGMRDKDSTNNIQLPSLVIWNVKAQFAKNKCYRYMPQDPDDAKDMCRYGPKLCATFITLKFISVQARAKSFWQQWARRPNLTVTAFRIAIFWTSSTQLVAPTSRECFLIVYRHLD